MTAKVIFYWVSNLSPAGFKVSVQLQPASKPQEGWQSVHFALVWPPKSFCIGFRTCRRRAGSKCLRAAAACHQAPRRVAKRPSGRLRAACQQAPRKVAKRPSKPASAFCGRQNHFLPGFEPAAEQASNASVQLQPAIKPQEGWQSPASALYGRQSHFLSGFEPAAGQASNASVQLQPATKPQEGW